MKNRELPAKFEAIEDEADLVTAAQAARQRLLDAGIRTHLDDGTDASTDETTEEAE